MFTKLSSLLVQDGVVSVKKVEEALQRQVIFGGGLDTILLEIGAVDELSLCRFLHVAAGVPAADLSSLADTDLRDAGMVQMETARSYGIVPIRKDGDLLHVVVKPGVGRAEFEELSYVLGLRIVPYVAPEVRVEELIHRAYGGELEHRFAVLLEKLGPAPDLRAAGVPAVVLGADEEVEIEAMLPDSGDVPAEAMAVLGDEAGGGESQPATNVDAAEPGTEPESGPTESSEGTQAGEAVTEAAVASAARSEEAPPSIQAEGAGAPVGQPVAGTEPEAAPKELQPGVAEGPRAGQAQVPDENMRGLTGATIPGLPVTPPIPPAEAVPEYVFQKSDTLVDLPAFEPESDWNEDEVETAPEATPWVGPTAEDLAKGAVRADTVRGVPTSDLAPVEVGGQEQAPEGHTRESVGRDEGVLVSGELSAGGPPPAEAGPAAGEESRQPKVVASLGDLVDMAREARGEIQVASKSEPAGEGAGPSVQVNLELESSGPGPVSVAAMEPAQAVEEMERAANRDEILELVVRAAVSRVAYASLFVVYGDQAVGRVAAGPAGLDHSAIRKVSLPLGAPSLFKTVVDTGSQFYGPVADDGLNFTVLTNMDRISAPNVLVMPIRLGRRVVCLLYCDNGSKPVEPSVVADLAVVPQAAARAFSKLILAAKKARYEHVSQPPDAVKAPADQVPEKSKGQSGSGWAGADSGSAVAARVAESPSGPEKVTAVAVEAGQSPDRLSRAAIDLMLDQVEQGGELAERARAVLLEGGAPVVEAALRRFPGRLVVDRHRPGVKLAPVSEHGPLLGLLVDMGNQVAGAFLPLLGAPDPEVRFYATYLFSEVVSDDAVALLYQRLFDEDAGIRRVARLAIQRCAQSAELRRSVLEHLRGVLQQGVPFHRVCAAEGVAGLKDKVAVPMLIDMLGHKSQEVADAAQEALVTITKHNFGQEPAPWWDWWQKNRDSHRVEWMLDALESSDLECRFLAMQELAELAGDTFGYQFDMGHDEVGAAVTRWRTWWNQVRSILAE